MTRTRRGTIAAVEQENGWLKLTSADPGHSQWYIDRFRALAADGVDLHGEARLIDAMVSRHARVLDAGCGHGRVGGYLATAGHEVVGVDLDPVLIEAARREHPGARWLVGDLSALDLPAQGITEGFDVIVSAGNVMTFLAPASRREVLRRLATHLRAGGRLVVGFGAGRGYPFDEFTSDAGAAGLVPDLRLASWDLRPFREDSDFLVSVLRAA